MKILKRLKNLKVYTQKDLIAYRDLLELRIKNVSNDQTKRDHEEYVIVDPQKMTEGVNTIKILSKNKAKVKGLIAFNNVFLGINKYIYDMELHRNMKTFLSDLVIRKNSKGDTTVRKLPDNIERLIAFHHEKMQQIDKKLTKRNNSFILKLINTIVVNFFLQLTESYK